MSIRSYQDLEVWKRGMDLAEMVYRLTRRFPKEELYGLTSQIRRATASIPANIAEGWARQGTAEFLQFLRIAAGSLRELETHLLLSQRVGITQPCELNTIFQEIEILGKQLISLQRSLRGRMANGE